MTSLSSRCPTFRVDPHLPLPLFLVLSFSTAYTFLINSTKSAEGSFAYSFPLFLLLSSLAKLVLTIPFFIRAQRSGGSGVTCAGAIFGWLGARHAGGGRTTTLGVDDGDALRETSGTVTGEDGVSFSWRVFGRYVVSALLYAANDSLVFVVLMYFDAVQYAVLVSTKIVVVALLTRTVLRRRLTDVQYVSFAVLTAGVVVHEYNFCEPCEARGDGGGGRGNATEGYLVVLVAEVIGAVAGILNEWLMKSAPRASVHYQNLNLYAASVLVYVPIVLAVDRGALFTSPLRGFTSTVWLMVPVNAARGMSISQIYKHATNMTKVFVISVSTLLQGLLAWMFASYVLSAQFFLGLLIISAALYMYATQKSDDIMAPETGRLYATVEEEEVHTLFEMDDLGGIDD